MDTIEKLAEEYTPDVISEYQQGKRQGFKDGYTAANKGVGMRWISVNERLPEKDIEGVVTKTSLGVKEICSFENGEWAGDLRGDKEEPEIVLEWLDESPSPSQPLPDAKEIDWDAIEKDFDKDFTLYRFFKADLLSIKRTIFTWFRARPEFQLRQNSEAPNKNSQP